MLPRRAAAAAAKTAAAVASAAAAFPASSVVATGSRGRVAPPPLWRAAASAAADRRQAGCVGGGVGGGGSGGGGGVGAAGPAVVGPPLLPRASAAGGGSRRAASAAAVQSRVACPPPPPPTTAADGGLHLECAAACAPAPHKRTAGEDAYFIQGNAAGVFDGVGGWSDRNVDAAVYSRYLAKLTARGVRHRGPGQVAAAFADAAAATRVGGSSTAVLAGLDGDRLRGLNLGDSGLWLIRDGRVVYKTDRQQHAFNYPYQVSWGDADVIQQASPIDVAVRVGDWVLLASDGLFDNVWEKDLLGVMDNVFRGNGITGVYRPVVGDRGGGGEGKAAAVRPVDVAQAVLERALEASVATHYVSPFAVEAKKHRDDARLEGKPDDVTVIVR
ncbi:hypothetical protein MMPV_008410 [Pyropia vietnamensis]